MLQYKVSLVTGAASGIGRAIALQFAREGAVIIAVDVNMKALEETMYLLKQQTPSARALSLRIDVSKPSDCEKAVKEALKAFGCQSIALLCSLVVVLLMFPFRLSLVTSRAFFLSFLCMLVCLSSSLYVSFLYYSIFRSPCMCE